MFGPLAQTNEQGEPTASYRWTGWVSDITDSISRCQENSQSIQKNLQNILQFSKVNPKDVNM